MPNSMSISKDPNDDTLDPKRRRQKPRDAKARYEEKKRSSRDCRMGYEGARTRFTISQAHLLLIIIELEGFSLPSPMRSPPNQRDRAKFCDYHCEQGHITDRCCHL